jgi:hypothetical protein
MMCPLRANRDHRLWPRMVGVIGQAGAYHGLSHVQIQTRPTIAEGVVRVPIHLRVEIARRSDRPRKEIRAAAPIRMKERIDRSMGRREAERSRMRKGITRRTCLFRTKDRTEIEPAMTEILRNLSRATSGIHIATSVAEDTHLRRDQGQCQSKTTIVVACPLGLGYNQAVDCSPNGSTFEDSPDNSLSA